LLFKRGQIDKSQLGRLTIEALESMLGKRSEKLSWPLQLLLPVDGIDVNMADENSATPLFLASAHGHTDIAPRLLANWRVDPSAPDDREQWMPLYAAARKSHVDVVKQLASCDGVLQ
jgi:ankyrin repeat protein